MISYREVFGRFIYFAACGFAVWGASHLIGWKTYNTETFTAVLFGWWFGGCAVREIANRRPK